MRERRGDMRHQRGGDEICEIWNTHFLKIPTNKLRWLLRTRLAS